MSRAKQYLVLLGGLGLIATVLYLASGPGPDSFPPPPILPQPGLSWLPAEATLVGGVELAELRQQGWLLETLRRAAGTVREDRDYRAFVEATGFDYTRDLDHLWISSLSSGESPLMSGVAEGHFARAKIVNYAREQGATLQHHQGIAIYEMRLSAPVTGQPESGLQNSRFAIAFLDDSHLALASDTERAMMVIDCWLGRAPAIDADEMRRDELLRLAAGRQVWVVDTAGQWQSLFSKSTDGHINLGAIVTQMAFGLRVSEEGVDATVEARCREPGQAERLHTSLKLVIVAGRLALGGQQPRAAQVLREALRDLTLARHGNSVEARVLLSPETVASLLPAVPADTNQPERLPQ